MPEELKYNILTFSDVPTPSYARPYRGVLFVDYAPSDKLRNVYVISAKAPAQFQNKEIISHSDYFDAEDFKENQYQLSYRLSSIVKLLFKLIKFRLSNEAKIDFIRTGSTYLSLLVWLTQTKKIPYFADICDFYSDLYGEYLMPLARPLKPLIFFLEKLALQRANLIFVDTMAQRKYQVEKLGVDSKKCVVLPNGVLLEKYPFRIEKDKEILKSYGFSKTDKILFYGGDISKTDGVETLLKFARYNPDVKVLIIGKGNQSYLGFLQKLVGSYRLKGRAIIDSFKPYQELHRYLSIADICLAPFRLTATSNTVECGKIILYLLSGKAILATRADGVCSLYKENISYFNDGDFEDFSNKLRKLLDNPIADKRRFQIRALGEKFDFKKIIEHEYFVIDQYFKNPSQDFTKYDYL